MSNSYKMPIIKDRPRNNKKSSIYWRTIRRNWNNSIRSYKSFWDDDFFIYDYDNLFLKNPKSIYNDYDYCDYVFIISKKNKNYNIYKRK